MSYKKGQVFACNPQTARGVATKLHVHKDRIVYTNGKSVIIRDLTNPTKSVTYSQHVHPTTVARISPSGYYCASGDAQGNVRIWDIAGEDQILKLEAKPISGRINDLAWDGESKRIIAVGDGREKYGHVFMFDTGSSAGEIIGHSKVVNSVSIRHERPFRAVTAGDDNLIIFHQGAPYKYDKTIKTHTRFVQEVKFAPSGAVFASVGSDSKIFLYDGKTGDTLAEVKDSPHTGSIMAVSWSPDSNFFVTSSGDKTVKLWDAQTQKVAGHWGVGNGVQDQQVGNAWAANGEILSLSLGGDLNVLDKRVGDKPSRIIRGPNKSVTASVLTPSTFYAGSYDGRITAYSTANGEPSSVEGDVHSNQVSGLTAAAGKVISVGFDDHVRGVEGSKMSSISPTNGQPRGVAGSEDGTVFVSTTNAIEVIKDKKKISTLNVNFGPSSVAVAPGGKVIAVGGEDQKVYLYAWDGSNLKQTAKLEANRGIVSSLAFSPSGKHLVAGDSSGKILLYDPSTQQTLTTRWSYHSGRVNSLAFSPNGKHIASGALDTHVYIWNVDEYSKNIPIKNAGPGGVNAVCWVGDKTVWSTGADGCIRSWEVAV